MFSITIPKRSISALAAAAALLTAAAPASAGTAVGNPGDPPVRGLKADANEVAVEGFMDYTDDASIWNPGDDSDQTRFTIDMGSVERLVQGTGGRGVATSEGFELNT